MKKFARQLFCVLCLLPFFGALSAQAESNEAVFTADLPFDASQAMPTWMHGAPVMVPGDGMRVAFRLFPPTGKDLLVHFVFDETEAASLRIEWLRDGESTPELLAENLGESLGVPNQRPLLVSASRMGGPGALLIQGGAQLNLNRVRFEWVSERTMLAAASRYVPVVVTASRLTLAEADIDGGPRPALQDEWTDRVVRAALTESAELLTPSLELQAGLEQAPRLARLEASFLGVYLDQEVWLVINDHEVGPLAIEVPTLLDPGHLGQPGQETVFAGWRRASIHVPADLLMPGENAIVLELRSPVNSGYRNRTFVRDAVLELSYPPKSREPDLTASLPELPALPAAEEPLPPVQSNLPTSSDVLSDFWRQNGGAF
jgi:hypothetical protein